MKLFQCEQGTDEWKECRRGLPTASSFNKIITSTGKPSTQRKNYMMKLAGEAVTGAPEETFKNSAMERGTEMESEARSMYEIITGETVEQVGFCTNDKSTFGASPDGLVGKDGLIEIKCPSSIAIAVGYLLDNKIPTAYIQQVQGQMLVTGRKWTDFMSYYPSMKPLIVRVKRDEEFIKKLNIELELFDYELTEIVNKIK